MLVAVFEAKDSAKASCLRVTLFALTCIDFILIFAVAVLCFFLPLENIVGEANPQDDDYTNDYSIWYKLMVIYQTLGMAMLSVFFLAFGYAAQRKIWRTFSSHEGWRKGDNFWRGLIRLNIIIIVCFCCFTLKATASYLLFQPKNSNVEMTDNPLHVSTWTWMCLSEWVPDIVPRMALLYLMSRNLSEEESARQGGVSNSGDGLLGRRSEAFSDEHHGFMGRSFAADSIDAYAGRGGGFGVVDEEKKDERGVVSADGGDLDPLKKSLLAGVSSV